MKSAGTSISGSRGMLRRARPATDDQVGEEAGLAGLDVVAGQRVDDVGGRWWWWRSCGLLLVGDAVAGELEEDVVERGGAQRELAHADVAAVEGDGDGADGGGAGVGADGDLVAVDLDRRRRPRRPSPRRWRASASPSTLATMTSLPTDRFRSSGVPSATMRPWSMMPTRWARASASSRYCVVRKMVMPSCSLSRRTSSHTWARLTGSSPVVGSSRNSTSGLCTRAAARSSRRFMPPSRCRSGRRWRRRCRRGRRSSAMRRRRGSARAGRRGGPGA